MKAPNIDDFIKHYQGVTNTADAFGVTRVTIYYWKKHGMPEQVLKAMKVASEVGYGKN